MCDRLSQKMEKFNEFKLEDSDVIGDVKILSSRPFTMDDVKKLDDYEKEELFGDTFGYFEDNNATIQEMNESLRDDHNAIFLTVKYEGKEYIFIHVFNPDTRPEIGMFFDKDYNLLHEVGCNYGKDPLNNWYQSLYTSTLTFVQK